MNADDLELVDRSILATEGRINTKFERILGEFRIVTTEHRVTEEHKRAAQQKTQSFIRWAVGVSISVVSIGYAIYFGYQSLIG